MQNLTFIKTTILVAIGAVVSYFFTLPLVSEIRVNQDQESLFARQNEIVQGVNQTLRNHQSTISSIPLFDREKLARFLPQEVDNVVLLRDIEMLLIELGITPTELSVSEASQQSQTQADSSGTLNLPSVEVSFAFEDTYETAKNFLSHSELHPYVLHITKMEMLPNEESGMIETKVTVKVFLHREATNNNQLSEEDFFEDEF